MRNLTIDQRALGFVATLAAGFVGASVASGLQQQPFGQQQRPEDPLAEAKRYFAICDYDQNGWISFEEASQALLVSRDEFFSYDVDKDGAIKLEEFVARHGTIVASQGLFHPPIPAPNRRPELPTPTRVWFERFDADSSNGWDPAELALAFDEVGLASQIDEELWARFDADASGVLESFEIEPVLGFTAGARLALGTTAKSLRELFGLPVPTPPGPGVVAGPKRLVGPLPVFDRLDVDGDGVCSLADLEVLEFPAALPIRPQTLIAALDGDGDGLLSSAELRAAFGVSD
jgi:hypothetical protein